MSLGHTFKISKKLCQLEVLQGKLFSFEGQNVFETKHDRILITRELPWEALHHTAEESV